VSLERIDLVLIVRLSTVVLILLALLGCSVPSTPAQLPTELAATTQPTIEPTAAATAIPTSAAAPTNWTIGLLDEPAELLPFSPDGRAAAPIIQAMFPAPVLGVSYAYTSTGVLSPLPTVANGDVQVQMLAGFLDATGQFTVTQTSQPTTTQQLSITYRWNPKIHWADGTPLTAADSVFAYDLYSQGPAPQEAEITRDLIERYELVDDYTSRAVLKPGRIDPNYLLTAWPPLPRHRLQERGTSQAALAEFAEHPLGYGPYTFNTREPGSHISLTRNPYWAGADTLPEELIFQFFSAADELRSAVVGGQVNIGVLENIPPDLYRFLDQDQQSGAAEVHYLAGPVYEHIDLNLADQQLQDIRVRRALAYAINRQALSDALFGGKVAPLHSWILPEQRNFYAGDEQLTRYRYDPAKAAALLDEAGLVDTNSDGVREGVDGQPLTLALLTTDTPLREEMARLIAADIEAVGIRLTTELQPIDQFYSPTGPLYRRTFQLALFAWISAADPGGLPLWSCNAIPMAENGYGGNNFSGWCLEAAEWPLRRANTTLDVRVRAQEYLAHQRLWTQEVPVIPIVQRPIVVLHQPKLEGIKPDPLAPITWNIDEWQRVQ